jgi:hypothetical protein
MVFIYDSCFQEDYAAQGIQAMKEDLLDRQFKLNVEYRIGGQVILLKNQTLAKTRDYAFG